MPNMCTPVRYVDRCNHVSLLMTCGIIFLLQSRTKHDSDQPHQESDQPHQESDQPHQESDDEEAAAEVSCEPYAWNYIHGLVYSEENQFQHSIVRIGTVLLNIKPNIIILFRTSPQMEETKGPPQFL